MILLESVDIFFFFVGEDFLEVDGGGEGGMILEVVEEGLEGLGELLEVEFGKGLDMQGGIGLVEAFFLLEVPDFEVLV